MRNKNYKKPQFSLALATILMVAVSMTAQTTAFSYQGKLNVSGTPANANFDFEFRLYDAVSDGAQIGDVQARTNVAVADGIFTVSLDFGGQFPGANRFLGISVRTAGVGVYTPLTPRQPITSSPYSIQTINSQMLGGIAASQYVQTGDPRLSDARPPTPGSPNYVQNTMTPQAGNFNVTGTGTADSLTANSTISVAGSAKPATAPAGQGRLYFDGLTNKLRVSENGDPFVDLVGATGVAGSGTPDTIPFWSGGTTLGNSQITQSVAGVQLPTNVQLAATAQGNRVQFGSPNGETGMTISGALGRADLRYDTFGTLRLLNGPANGNPPPAANGISINTSGNIEVGPTNIAFIPAQLSVRSSGAALSGASGTGSGVLGLGSTTGVYGEGGSRGVHGTSFNGVGVSGSGDGPGSVAVRGDGTSWFRGNTTPLSVANVGLGTGIGIGSSPGFGYIFAYDYEANAGRTLALNTSGGNVGIGTATPNQTLEVNGRARITSIPAGTWAAGVCYNAAGDLLSCGTSSLRFKTNVHRYSDGLDILGKLNPISYNWKDGGEYDIGLGAEDVSEAAPFFAFRNKEGVVEGVRYERLNMVLINAIKEQQAQIEMLQNENRSLSKRLSTIERRLRPAKRK